MLDIEANTPLVPRETREATQLLALAQSLAVDPIDLDEAVHDAAAHCAAEEVNRSGGADDEVADNIYNEAGHSAAEINNGGLERQVTYLVFQYGAAAAERIVCETASSN
ncbi:hypothetical protein [Streptomyces sp. NRRL F-5053]|uniref:hypothetical protein n=1 Tax=Streptomyces sp. NRRL F-5053 TaxID=1463854 RepID=UPI0004C50D14|nr:hypothetical protein [Streptomyces sp. NRRL F-5053]